MDLLQTQRLQLRVINFCSPQISCTNNTTSIEKMVDFFGRLPVHERQWTRHLHSFPQVGPSAYMINGDIILQGDPGLPTYQHEITHVLDFFRPNTGLNVTGANSVTDKFNDAMNADACIPDGYASSGTFPFQAYLEISS